MLKTLTVPIPKNISDYKWLSKLQSLFKICTFSAETDKFKDLNKSKPSILHCATQSRTFFIGVGRYTKSSAVSGDLGWLPVRVNLWINLIREWCRLHALDSSGLNIRFLDMHWST